MRNRTPRTLTEFEGLGAMGSDNGGCARPATMSMIWAGPRHRSWYGGAPASTSDMMIAKLYTSPASVPTISSMLFAPERSSGAVQYREAILCVTL